MLKILQLYYRVVQKDNYRFRSATWN